MLEPRDALSKKRLRWFYCLVKLSPTCPAAEERLLLGNGLLLSTFHVIVHMAVEPLGVIKCALETNETQRSDIRVKFSCFKSF